MILIYPVVSYHSHEFSVDPYPQRPLHPSPRLWVDHVVTCHDTMSAALLSVVLCQILVEILTGLETPQEEIASVFDDE